MINLQQRKQYGTKKNIKAYREHCIKNDCFTITSFEQWLKTRSKLTGYI